MAVVRGSVLLLAALLSASAVGAASSGPSAPGIQNPTAVSTPTTLYFHLLDALQEFPINTQLPDPSFARDSPHGPTVSTLTCLQRVDAGVQNGFFSSEYHQYFGYSSPGYVEYNNSYDGSPRTASERESPWDIHPDLDAPFTLHWSLETSAGLPSTSPVPASADPYLLVPDVAVHAWMRTGDMINLGAGFKEGKLLAEGETVGNLGGDLATSTTSPSGDVVWRDVVDSDGAHHSIYDYTLTMAWQADALIPKDAGFYLQVAVFLPNPACTDPANKILMPNLVMPHTDLANPPRMELAIFDPLRVLYIHPQLVGQDWVFHTSVQSVWGNYDVDETVAGGTNGLQGGISFDIAGPGPAPSLHRASIVQRFHEYNHHADPVDVTYVWPYVNDSAPEGTYTVRFLVNNDQRTAVASALTTFTLGDPSRATLCGATEVIVPNATTPCVERVLTPDGRFFDPATQKASGLSWALGGLVVAASAAFFRRRR